MIANAGSRRRRMAVAPGLALIVGFGLAVASQPALAGLVENERSVSLPARTGAQADTPIK